MYNNLIFISAHFYCRSFYNLIAFIELLYMICIGKDTHNFICNTFTLRSEIYDLNTRVGLILQREVLCVSFPDLLKGSLIKSCCRSGVCEGVFCTYIC